MISTLIVEDKYYTRKGLISLIESLGKDLKIVDECQTIKTAVQSMRQYKPGLVFLDIDLPDGDAFDFLKHTYDFNFDVIFITAHSQFALPALKKGAIDYLLKPVDSKELNEAIDKVFLKRKASLPKTVMHTRNREEQEKSKLILRFSTCYQVIQQRDLMFCRSENGYTTFFLNCGKQYVASRPLKSFASLLNPDFIQTHQSYMVNLNYVDKYLKEGYCILTSGCRVPVASSRRTAFTDKLLWTK